MDLDKLGNKDIFESRFKSKFQKSRNMVPRKNPLNNKEYRTELKLNSNIRLNKEEINSKIREVTKGVFLQLSDYVSDVREKSPMFGFPGLCYSPIHKTEDETNWQKITKIIVNPTFKQKHSFL